MKAYIFFHHFDLDRINEAKSWNDPYPNLYLRLTNPLGKNKGIASLDEAFDQYVYKGVIDVERAYTQGAEEAFRRIQNIDTCHVLGGRSMMTGDVIIIDGKGFFVDGVGFSRLSRPQVERFMRLVQMQATSKMEQ